jgi:hypothetical protein
MPCSIAVLRYCHGWFGGVRPMGAVVRLGLTMGRKSRTDEGYDDGIVDTH